jgi:hypothetical protein
MGPVFKKPTRGLFTNQRNALVIPDCHLPYEHPKALEFCVKLQDLFQVAPEDVFHLGDLEDNFYLGQWPKGADYPHTPNQEVERAREKIKEWGRAFPKMKICESNHASRYFRKASASEIPSQMLRTYREFFDYPKGWDVQECFLLKDKTEVLLFHGEGFANPQQASVHFGKNVVTGHFHSKAGVWWSETMVNRIYAVNSGCLIDYEQYAFHYAKHAKFKPSLGATILMDGFRVPFYVPML